MAKKRPIQPVSVVPGDDRNIDEKPTRRQFNWEYKQAILEEIESNRHVRGSIGEILRREGLYASQVALWRDEAEARAAGTFKPKRRGRKSDPNKELKQRLAKLEKENAKLKKELHVSKVLIDLQKK